MSSILLAQQTETMLGNLLEAITEYGLSVMVIVLTALLANFLIRLFIKRVVRGLQTDKVQRGLHLLRARTPKVLLETHETASLRRSQRAETIGVILRSATAVVIFLVALFSIMSLLRIPLVPIVTGTTVITAVIGFGAQNIVRDFLSGFFIVVEDQYGVGDYIDVGTASGTVEALSLRITRLRNADGTLWQIPNGEIKRVGNKSQLWSRALVEFRVNLSADLDNIEAILAREAHELTQDELYANSVVDEPEVWGPDQVDGDGVLYKIAIKTRPLEQWRISRAIRTRVKDAFDRAGVRFASALPDIYAALPNSSPDALNEDMPPAKSSQKRN